MLVQARPELLEAGFEEGCNEYERFVMDRDGVHTEGLGCTGPHGSWYGVVTRDGVRRCLRGPKGGLRLFKTAAACLAALEREVSPWIIIDSIDSVRSTRREG